MNQKLRNNIVFAQTVVSLGRDLILIVIAIFAVLIVFFGGDPKKLSELDWALLVASSLFVVIAPAIGFYLIVLSTRLFEQFFIPQIFVWGDSINVPRGMHIFFTQELENYR